MVVTMTPEEKAIRERHQRIEGMRSIVLAVYGGIPGGSEWYDRASVPERLLAIADWLDRVDDAKDAALAEAGLDDSGPGSGRLIQADIREAAALLAAAQAEVERLRAENATIPPDVHVWALATDAERARIAEAVGPAILCAASDPDHAQCVANGPEAIAECLTAAVLAAIEGADHV